MKKKIFKLAIVIFICLGLCLSVSAERSTISCGMSKTYVIKTDGSLWEVNISSTLQNGKVKNGCTPVKIMDGVIQVAVSSDDISDDNTIFVVTYDGTLYAWGKNKYGQLGNGTKSSVSQENMVRIMDNVKAVSAGYDCHVVAVKTDGTLYAWGKNTCGQIGDGTTTDKLIPTKIMDDVKAISCGICSTFAIKNDGCLWAWGMNDDGQLGDGTTINRHSPVKIMEEITSVSTSGNHTLAIKNDGSVWAWGLNSLGAIGNGEYNLSQSNRGVLTPVMIKNDEKVISIYAAPYHSLLATKDGDVFSWGYNYAGQLGYQGTKGYIPMGLNPRRMDIGNAVSVFGENDCSLVLKTDGSLWGCGKCGDVASMPFKVYFEFEKIMDNIALPDSTPAKPAVETKFHFIPKSGNLYTFVNKHSLQINDLSIIDNTNYEMEPGYCMEFASNIYSPDDITYTSSNPDVIEVVSHTAFPRTLKKDGFKIQPKVNAKNIGAAVITARLPDGSATSVNVYVKRNSCFKLTTTHSPAYLYNRGAFLNHENKLSTTVDIFAALKNSYIQYANPYEDAGKNTLHNVKISASVSGSNMSFEKTSYKNTYESYIKELDIEQTLADLLLLYPYGVNSSTFSTKKTYTVSFVISADELESPHTEKVTFTVENYSNYELMAHEDSSFIINAHKNFINNDPAYEYIKGNDAVIYGNAVKDTWEYKWNNTMFNFVSIDNLLGFDNPYDIVVADVISELISAEQYKEYSMTLLFEAFADTHAEVYDALYDECKDIFKDGSSLIDNLSGEYFFGDLTIKPSAFEKLLKQSQYTTDDIIFKDGDIYNFLSKRIKSTNVQNRVNKVFAGFEKVGTAWKLIGTSMDISNDIIKGINYHAVINAYIGADKEIKAIVKSTLDAVYNTDASNSKLISALQTFVNTENNYGKLTAELENIFRSGAEIAWDVYDGIFRTWTESVMINYLSNLSCTYCGAATTLTASSVLGGVIMGWNGGKLVSDILCDGSDKAAEMKKIVILGELASSAKIALEQYETKLINSPSLDNVKYFEKAFEFFKIIQTQSITHVQKLNESKAYSFIEIVFTNRENEVEAINADLENTKEYYRDMSCHKKNTENISSILSPTKTEERTFYSSLPTFEITLNNVPMDSVGSQYPLLVHNDITYVPMTYNDARFLGLETSYTKETGLVITSGHSSSGKYVPYVSDKSNSSSNKVELVTGKITVNGKSIDNSAEEYPLLLFRGVTYFPLTWRFAVEEFGWEYSFDKNKGLVINSKEEVKLSSISVKSKPNKTSYFVGDKLSTSGLTLTAKYSDGSSKTVSSGFTCYPTSLTSAGTRSITVSYEGKTTTFSVSVQTPTVSSISIKTKPSKTSYYVGDKLSTSGLTLTAKYSDGSSKTVSSGFTCSPTSLASAGTKSITVSYEGKTTTFSVSVQTPTVSSISIKTKPSKTSYYVGDKLSTSGLTLTAKYSDGSSKTVSSGFTCSPTSLTSAGTKSIMVSYGGKTTSFTISVQELKVTSISVKTKPAKTTYSVGSNLNTSGLTLTANYSNGSTKTITSGFKCTPLEQVYSGTRTITVIYEGKTATFDIIVNPKEQQLQETTQVQGVAVTSISINQKPKKLSYYVGETLNTSGLALIVKYADGSIKKVTSGFGCTPTVLLHVGTNTITVSYGGKTTTFGVTVFQK